jgi:hypothetical protein
MEARRLRIKLWWARVRLRWRRRARRLEAAHTLEATVTSGIVIATVLTITSHAEDSTKLSIGILLCVVELVFLFGRLILRKLREIETRMLPVLPDDLPTTLFHHLDAERQDLLTRARELSDSMVCDLEKHEMYAELIGLTDTVTSVKAGTLGAAIYAVSGTNVEDFQREVLAREYLDANKRAVEQQVTVRRLFLVNPHANRAQIAAIMRVHETALQALGSRDSGVRWLLKSKAGNDSDLDFAVFANEVLVRQVLRPGGAKGEVTVNEMQITPALEAFERLWDHKDSQPVSEFQVRQGRR